MDPYEATRVVYSKIQSIDPENASKIMGFLLIQDHGEKEMIRLAFGPDTLVHNLIITAYNELGLSSAPSSPSPFHPHPHPLSRQNSASSRLPSSSSWSPSALSSSNFTSLDNLIIPNSTSSAAAAAASYASVVATNGNGFTHPNPNSELFDELHLQDQLSFLNEGPKNPDLFYQSSELGTSPSNSASDGGMLIPNWAMNNGAHRRSLSVTDIGMGSDPFGWKPCLYYARGYCKNGTACRFLHAPPDSPDSTIMAGSPGKFDMMEQCQEFLLRSKSQHQQQRLSSASQLLASTSFPYSPRHSEKCINFMLQQQQNESQRAAAAAAAGLMLGGEDFHQFGRSRLERNDLVNAGSKQIYLTFPADSTFREEDVSNYFSTYGPVQDVRIPYQQKRMFGFVTFQHSETVKLILAKGNPHFVCDARVLVKPYKEKGNVPNKKQQQQLVEREFSPSTTPTCHDHRDPYDLQFGMQMQSSPRLLYNGHDLLMRRKLEEQAELQQAIELQSRKLMGLHLFDGNKHHRRNLSTGTAPIHSPTYPHSIVNQNFMIPTSSPDQTSPEVLEEGWASSSVGTTSANITDHNTKQQTEFSCMDNGKKENSKLGDCNIHDSVEHNLPDSPFASPITNNGDQSRLFFTATAEGEQTISATSVATSSMLSSSSNNNDSTTATSMLPATSTIDMASFKSHFMQMPRHSSDNGAIQM